MHDIVTEMYAIVDLGRRKTLYMILGTRGAWVYLGNVQCGSIGYAIVQPAP